tara:strand:+ start:67 stop:294 length:228 start_codon:yes stop_codon:yes gene_type:complete
MSGPFKMNYKGSSFPFKSSPTKNAPGPPDHKHPHPKPPSKRELKAYKMPHMLDVSLGEKDISAERRAEIKAMRGD